MKFTPDSVLIWWPYDRGKGWNAYKAMFNKVYETFQPAQRYSIYIR